MLESKMRALFVALGVLIAGVALAYPGSAQPAPYQIAQATCLRYVSTTNSFGLYKGEVFGSLPAGIPSSYFVQTNLPCSAPTASPIPTAAPTGSAIPTATPVAMCTSYVATKAASGLTIGQVFSSLPTGYSMSDFVVTTIPCTTPPPTPSPSPSPTPSASPFQHVIGTPYPGATAYPTPGGVVPTSLPTGTVTSGQVTTYGCNATFTCAGETWIHAGIVAGTQCKIKITFYDHEPAAATQLLLAPGEQLCSTDYPGDASNWTTNPATITTGAFSNQPVFYTSVNLNGTITPIAQGYTGRQAEVGVGSGTSYAIVSGNNGHDIEFTISTYTLAQALAAVAHANAPINGFIGAFLRPGVAAGGGNFGDQEPGIVSNPPQPYPVPNPNNLFGHNGYCTGVAANGYSILTGTPVDYQKFQNIVGAGVQWTRFEVYPEYVDYTHMTGVPPNLTNGGQFAQLDASICAQLANGIEPIVNLNIGPVNYGPYSGPPTLNQIYKSPAEAKAYAIMVMSHIHAAFPSIKRVDGIANENNGGCTSQEIALTSPAQPLGMKCWTDFMRSIYQGAKSVDPTYFVYSGQVNMDPGSSPLAFFQGFYQNNCGIGQCEDGFSIHTEPYNLPLATYDPAVLSLTGFFSPPGYQSDGPTITSLPGLVGAIKSYGETNFIHINITESGYKSTAFASYPGGSEAYQASMWGNWLNAGEQLACGAPTQPTGWCLDGIMPQNFDEDFGYDPGSFFVNFGLTDQTSTPERLRPAYFVVAAANGIAPNALPTLNPITTPATPYPSPNPPLDSFVKSLEPTAYYRLNDTSGTVAVDTMLNYNGTYTGNATVGTGTALTLNDAVAPSFPFAGTGNVISGAPLTVPAVNGASFTCALSMTLLQAPFSQNICDNNNANASAIGTQLRFNSSGHLIWELGTTAGHFALTSTVTFTTGTPYRIIATYDGVTAHTMTLYSNGTAIGTLSSVTGTIVPTALPMWLTGDASTLGDFASGVFSEWYFGPFSMSSGQVSQDYLYATGI